MQRGVLVVALIFSFISISSSGFAQEKFHKRNCLECHTLTIDEAEQILVGQIHKVIGVKASFVPGMWEIAGMVGDVKMPIFMDFSKKFILIGVPQSIDGNVGGVQRMMKEYPILGIQEKMKKEMTKKILEKRGML
jgi:hypothetical protein